MKIAVLAASLLVTAGMSHAATLDFDGLSDGDIITGDDFGGVVFTSGSAEVRAVNMLVRAGAGPVPTGFSQPIAIETDPFVSDPFVGTFSLPGITSVSVALGDFGGDADDLFLSAFDSSMNLLATTSQTLGSGVFAFETLSLTTSEEIAFVEFGSTTGFANSVFFDNFTFEAAAIPLPASAVLLLSALGGAGFVSRRRNSVKQVA